MVPFCSETANEPFCYMVPFGCELLAKRADLVFWVRLKKFSSFCVIIIGQQQKAP
jgi:hypothetical protein